MPLTPQEQIELNGLLQKHGLISANDAGTSIPAAAPQRSALQDFGRQLGLTGRYAVEGILSPATFAGDNINALLDYNTGSHLGSLSDSLSNGLTDIGFPNPETPTERVVGDAARAVASVGGLVKTGETALMKYALPKISEALTTAPGVQAVAAGTGAASGGLTREAGGGPLAQFLASMVGGVGGGYAAAKTLPEAITGMASSNRSVPSGNKAQNEITKEILKRPDAPELIAAAKQRMAESEAAGVPITLAEALNDPALMTRTGQLTHYPEVAGQTKEFFDTRNNLVTQALKKVGDNISPHQTVDDAANAVQDATEKAIKRMQDNMSAQAKPFYDEALTKKVPPNALKALVKKFPIIGDVMTKVQTDKLYAQELGKESANSVRILDQTKKEMDDMIAAARQGGERNKARLLTEAKNKMVNLADKYAPSYKQARDIYAHNAEEDMPKIEKFLGGLVKDKKTPDQVIKGLFDGTAQSTKTITNEIGQEAARAGGKGRLLQAMETNKGNTDLGIPSKIYGSDRDVEKWKAVLGDRFTQFDATMKTIEQAAKGEYARPHIGAQTQGRGSEKAIIDAGLDAVSGNHLGVLRKLIDSVTGKDDPKYLQQMADVLLSKDGKDMIDELSRAKFPSRKQKIITNINNMIKSKIGTGLGASEGYMATKKESKK